MNLHPLRLFGEFRRARRRLDELEARCATLREQRDAARDQRERYRAERDRLRNGSMVIAGVTGREPYYYVARNVGLAYLRIPKAACTTIKTVLLHYTDPDRFASEIDGLASNIRAIHRTEDLVEETMDPGDCLRFTFVRHPFDRFLSFYHNILIDRGHQLSRERLAELNLEFEPFGFSAGMTFEEYCEVVFSTPHRNQNPHVKRQVDILLGSGTLAVDFIGRLESFERDLARLTAGIDAPKPEVRKLNSSSHKGWRNSQLLDPGVVGKLGEFYREDLRFLGYARK